MLGAKNAGEPCVRANYQPLQQLQFLAQNTKDAKPRIMLKPKVETSRSRPVAAFPASKVLFCPTSLYQTWGAFAFSA